jgi:Ca-activated chloride channel homolog
MSGPALVSCALAGAVLLAAAAPALAQRPDAKPAPPVFAVGTGVVNVTVTVLDKDGKLVTDLGPDDFSVFEDGRRQQITLFGRAHEPGQDEILALDLGLLMDTSQSMLEELRLSQEAALRFLDAVPRARDLLTVFFAQDIQISRYTSESQQGLIQRIEEATGGGNTALYDAIAVYLSRVSDSTGRKVMVLFSDGEDTISTTTRSEVLQLVKSSGVTIYPIGFTAGLSSGTQGTLAKAAKCSTR